MFYHKFYSCKASFLYERQQNVAQIGVTTWVRVNLNLECALKHFWHNMSSQSLHLNSPTWLLSQLCWSKRSRKMVACMVFFLHEQHPCASSNAFIIKFSFKGINSSNDFILTFNDKNKLILKYSLNSKKRTLLFDK